MKTVKLTPVAKETKAPIVKSEPKKVAPPQKQKPKEPPKVVVKKEKAKEKVPEKAKEIPKETPKVVSKKEWVALAKEKIGKIEAIADNTSAKSITTPVLIQNFESELSFADTEAFLSLNEMAYRDELAVRLKLSLKLPEYGEVKVKLTVERSGKIAAIKILEFKSKKNADYIEKHLPRLEMPKFGSNFSGSTTHDFTIIMSNE